MRPDNENIDPRTTLLNCFQQALVAVNGHQCVVEYFSQYGKPWSDNIALIAIGKAANSMAEGAAEVMGEQIQAGLIIGKAPCSLNSGEYWERFRLVESSHPIPDERSLEAGQSLIEFIELLPDAMPVLFLISGGASALVEVLAEDILLEDLGAVNRDMLANGMGIKAINRVRKALSLIKGGKLCRHLTDTPVLNLLISDVPGDDLAVIGSGLLLSAESDNKLPSALPETTRQILKKLRPTDNVPGTNAPVQSVIIANNAMAREAAAKEAASQGYSVIVHDELLDDEVTKLADKLFEFVQSAKRGIHIWGAEPAVNLPDKPGRGGRNQHLALMLAKRIAGMDNIHILVAATDGSDGLTNDAGGLVDGETLQRGEQEGLDVNECIQAANAGEFLEASGALLSTGPTGSNVMDLVLICKT